MYIGFLLPVDRSAATCKCRKALHWVGGKETRKTPSKRPISQLIWGFSNKSRIRDDKGKPNVEAFLARLEWMALKGN